MGFLLGLFVLGKTKLLVGNRPPIIRYRKPTYSNRPSRPKGIKGFGKFKKRRGPFTYRKKKTSRRPRPHVRNHMSRHSPILVNEPKPGMKVLAPVRPLMLDDVAYDANYDELNYDDDAYFDAAAIENNLAQRKGK
jgi:hypothetical protein